MAGALVHLRSIWTETVPSSQRRVAMHSNREGEENCVGSTSGRGGWLGPPMLSQDTEVHNGLFGWDRYLATKLASLYLGYRDFLYYYTHSSLGVQPSWHPIGHDAPYRLLPSGHWMRLVKDCKRFNSKLPRDHAHVLYLAQGQPRSLQIVAVKILKSLKCSNVPAWCSKEM